MIDLATSFEPAPLYFLFLLLGMGVLLLTVYSITNWRAKRRTSKRRKEAEIKWQRRIEAIREAEYE